MASCRFSSFLGVFGFVALGTCVHIEDFSDLQPPQIYNQQKFMKSNEEMLAWLAHNWWHNWKYIYGLEVLLILSSKLINFLMKYPTKGTGTIKILFLLLQSFKTWSTKSAEPNSMKSENLLRISPQSANIFFHQEKGRAVLGSLVIVNKSDEQVLPLELAKNYFIGKVQSCDLRCYAPGY